METRDDGQPVRPIPIEDRGGEQTSDGRAPRAERGLRPQRPWLPLLVSGAALIGLIGSVVFVGAVEFQDARATDPRDFTIAASDGDATPPATLPPMLEESIPGISDRLTLITAEDHALWILVWDPSFRLPEMQRFNARRSTAWPFASFDTSGRLVAVTGLEVREEEAPSVQDTPSLWIASPNEVERAYRISRVSSAQWHATDVARISYVRELNSSFTLVIADVDPLTKLPTTSDLITVFDVLPHIVRWDRDGFVLQIGEQTVALDSAGALLWSADGRATTASPDFVPQLRRTGEHPGWYLLDRLTGDAESFDTFGIDASEDSTQIVASSSNNIFAAVTRRFDRTTVAVIGSDLIAPRIIQVPGDPTPFRFTSDAAFLILRTADGNDLLFLGWRSGGTHRFDVPAGHYVLAINLG
ncbi:MAG: hypothetical protein QGM46_03015 [Actinomycetota bacterium]|nr:hypothetical protein [Actinomycetota bacterium]MDK1019929.1 hypothetical protein [Actinomycetota bacterium]MDK1027619.1 hypothetical protein [Actinomycetota bacterium]MDK1038681.1 hypothetical protein [Actinomycetota bacterium]MDK1096374.1 hypothetical protein [Actinomycetota bacterium]